MFRPSFFFFQFPFLFFHFLPIQIPFDGSSNDGLSPVRLTFYHRITSHGVSAPKLLWGAPICSLGLKIHFTQTQSFPLCCSRINTPWPQIQFLSSFLPAMGRAWSDNGQSDVTCGGLKNTFSTIHVKPLFLLALVHRSTGRRSVGSYGPFSFPRYIIQA